MSKHAPALALLLVACGPETPPTTATVLALGDVPARVDTLVFSAFGEGAELVASATVSAPTRTVALGLPAETPLELRVVAYTSTPTRFGISLPAFATRRIRTIPLQRSTVVLDLVVEPAGLLLIEPDGRGLTLVSDREEFPPAAIEGSTVEVLPAGSYGFQDVRGDLDTRIASGERVWVEAEAVGRVRPRREARPEAGGLQLSFLDASGAPAGPGVPARARIEGLGPDGEPRNEPRAEVDFVLRDVAGVVIGSGALMGLPAELSVEAAANQPGFELRARRRGVRLPSSVVRVEVAPVPGPPRALRAELLDPDLLDVGEARLRVAVVDARGLLARGPAASIDIEMSDPWVRPVETVALRVEPETSAEV
ncbi:MAG: hypothetical protein AAFU79_18695, partial [Myxococcota bacterium]